MFVSAARLLLFSWRPVSFILKEKIEEKGHNFYDILFPFSQDFLLFFVCCAVAGGADSSVATLFYYLLHKVGRDLLFGFSDIVLCVCVCVCCTTNSDSFAVCSETVQHRLNFYSKTAKSSLNLWCTGGSGVFLLPPFLLFLIYFVVPGEEKKKKKIGTKTLHSLPV